MNNYENLIKKIPKEVSHVTKTLEKAGFEAYLVGGCVRDLIMGRVPKDWDVTTNAKPEQIIGLFEKTVYENKFGTVAVIHETVSQETLRQIEVTPYRIEAKYSDFRHPDEVKFSDKLEDDLKRRDFTINALALGHSARGGSLPAGFGRRGASGGKEHPNGHIVDLFGGLSDIEQKTVRTVGNPDDRFGEDALRMLRAIRLSLQLDFSVSEECTASIVKNADLIKKISAERIRDELEKIILSESPSAGVAMLQKFGLLKHIIPELPEGIGCEQGGEHVYPVWEHLLEALQHAANKNWPLPVRLAALFHDIGKPRSRRSSALGTSKILDIPPPFWRNLPSANFSVPKAGVQEASGGAFEKEWLSEARDRATEQKHSGSHSKKKWTFYGHEVIGARMAQKIMERLKFPNKEMELVEKLVRNHMFFSDPEKITLSAVRRIIVKVDRENIWELMKVRECDRVGMKKKEAPYRLRKYFAMIEEALRDPISVSQLKIDGNFMKENLGIVPGPRMGWILHALLEEVLDDPLKNTMEHLSELAKSLNGLPDGALQVLGDRGKSKKEELEEHEIEKLHEKHGVRK